MIISEKKPIINQELQNIMKNIPRVFLGDDVHENMEITAAADTAHYLTRVMRTNEFLAFGGGREFNATISTDGRRIFIGNVTEHIDPAGDKTLYFAPIKKTDDLINMATQMGVARFVPVLTDCTAAHHINWARMRKIAIEAAEQSNRNSVPEIAEPIKFSDLDLSKIVFADERAAHGHDITTVADADAILVGPEGGFSDAEFAALDAAGARGVSLGRTILRAELAAAVAISRLTKI